MSYWSKTFDGRPEHVSEVREFTRKAIGDYDGVDLVELVASELAGNAVRHSDSGEPGGEFTLHLATFLDRWQVRVDDAGGPKVPHICEPKPIDSIADLDAFGDEVETGRGLALVAAVSSKWGVLGDQAGHAVWVEILMPQEMAARKVFGVRGTVHRGWSAMTLRVDDAAEQNLARIVGGLRAVRLVTTLSQNALSSGLPVRGRAISEWETGLVEPTLDHLMQWSRELGRRLVIVGPDNELRDGSPRPRAGETWEVLQRRRLASPLRNRRLALRLTQKELGELVGVSRDSIQRWEHAHVPPRPIALIVWAHKLECSLALQAIDVPATGLVSGVGGFGVRGGGGVHGHGVHADQPEQPGAVRGGNSNGHSTRGRCDASTVTSGRQVLLGRQGSSGLV
ncbi:helix-turn-helix domain-containing protein [Catenulispora sp. NL8]|uniref:Helix-turn-helix domain-containing protein n=1 Tax=Catenulispora pinistramenti TaxID=2705254 RepID=A0ABS5KN06_9ACTN|nr:helix-turn-helix domain-containing protein [Catenulispora pinistramenti]MBS2547447.1 helix-turn-helix domain-containing protein [Catenulispora pinistramenti]